MTSISLSSDTSVLENDGFTLLQTRYKRFIRFLVKITVIFNKPLDF